MDYLATISLPGHLKPKGLPEFFYESWDGTSLTLRGRAELYKLTSQAETLIFKWKARWCKDSGSLIAPLVSIPSPIFSKKIPNIY